MGELYDRVHHHYLQVWLLLVCALSLFLNGITALQSHSTKSKNPYYYSGVAMSSSTRENESNDGDIVSRLNFRRPTPKDIPRCYEIEAASYPADEAASLQSLYYRQENAGPYFQLCTIPSSDNTDETIIGFVCSTRCTEFTEESMSQHTRSGKLLAIHSVVVEEQYRGQGIARTMLQKYVNNIKQQQNYGINSMVLLAKKHLLGFYVQCGFQVNRPSPIVHGKELWYELEQSCHQNPRSLPKEDESWFCKTEQFKRPYPEVKPFLDEHKKWVEQLRDDAQRRYHHRDDHEPHRKLAAGVYKVERRHRIANKARHHANGRKREQQPE